ncbi:C6 zinc finger domain-containing protein [Colletotrichum tofieldiae]|uniref:C6 zinc finger domain-containing protein n=1 Tax=Colletotrichum tofieldiae TaxID=708197 RepID=A0A166YU72_9PEZI|nr:C6 zinc finger domain-containing protein [Colletotrichum tofieldiae]
MPLNDDSLADLELLEYWHRHPVTNDFSDAMRHVQYDYVRLGFSHHYLLNSILAVAALQLFSEDRSRAKWYARAVAHQQAAISRARPHFQLLDEAHSRALLGFSAFTSMYAAAEPVLRPTRMLSLQTQFNPVEELIHGFRFARCTRALVQQKFSPLITSDPWLLVNFGSSHPEIAQDLEVSFPQLALLQGYIEHRCNGRQKAACLHAVKLLFHKISMLSRDPENPGHIMQVWSWGLEVQETFLDMCLEQHAVALIILAHFPVLMSLKKGHWCTLNWPGVLFEHIVRVLGDGWENALKWPRDVTHGSVINPLSTATHHRLALVEV